MIAGETDPQKLAEMCTHWRLKSTQEEIALAVEGNFTEHHMFMIRMIRRSIANIEAEIADLDAEIDRRMAPIDGIIERLCGIPSMDRTSVKELIAEIGVDMEVFPTADHLASWAGMSPGNNESAGKKKLAHEPREQDDESDNVRMRMVRKPYQEHVFLHPIQETGSTKRQEESHSSTRT